MVKMLYSEGLVVFEPKLVHIVNSLIIVELQRYSLHKLQKLHAVATFLIFLSGVLLSSFQRLASVFLFLNYQN